MLASTCDWCNKQTSCSEFLNIRSIYMILYILIILYKLIIKRHIFNKSTTIVRMIANRYTMVIRSRRGSQQDLPTLQVDRHSDSVTVADSTHCSADISLHINMIIYISLTLCYCQPCICYSCSSLGWVNFVVKWYIPGHYQARYYQARMFSNHQVYATCCWSVYATCWSVLLEDPPGIVYIYMCVYIACMMQYVFFEFTFYFIK